MYRAPSIGIVHAAILNNRSEFSREYLDRGCDVNQKDFQEWTPLHCAVYVGNVPQVKQLLSRIYISVHSKNDEG